VVEVISFCSVCGNCPFVCIRRELSVTSNTSYVHREEATQSKSHYTSVLNAAYLVCLVCLACLFVKSSHSISPDIKAPCIQRPKYCRDLKREGWPHYTKPRRTEPKPFHAPMPQGNHKACQCQRIQLWVINSICSICPQDARD
jgi:hypothetical protein